MWLGSHVAPSASAGFVGRGGRNKAELKQEFIKSTPAHNARLCVRQHTAQLRPNTAAAGRVMGGGGGPPATNRVWTVGKKMFGSVM